MENNLKQIYDSLHASGDLQDMFPTMTGNWEHDKADFTILQTMNTSLDWDDEIDDDYEYYEENEY